MTDRRQQIGRRGERAAEDFLTKRGHQVLARRFRTRRGELDLVTRSGEHLYFIEVKTRRAAEAEDPFGGGFEAVDARRQGRIARAAEAFLASRPEASELIPHFAVIAIEQADGAARLRFLPDAFDVAAA